MRKRFVFVFCAAYSRIILHMKYYFLAVAKSDKTIIHIKTRNFFMSVSVDDVASRCGLND